jgi:mannose-1-phosphate guanylyltransferase
MPDSHRYVLISAGGAGTRLWPLSRANRPKQFERFVGEETLFQHIASLALKTVPIERIMVMTVAPFADYVRQQLPNLPAENLLLEPDRRDNGPAIVFAMLALAARDPQATAAILWSDHLIRQPEAFPPMLEAAFAAAEERPGHLVTVGAKPTKPDASLGYIQMSHELAEYHGVPVFAVKQFIEKPEQARADKFVKSWDYLWNVGYKIMSAQHFLEKLSEARPELQETIEGLRTAVLSGDTTSIAAAYSALPKESIEYLFTQHLKDILVVPADIGWSDVGTWNTLHEVFKNGEDVITQGDVVQVASKNTLALAKDRPITLVGVENLIVVDSGDAILVMSKNNPDIKAAYAQLEQDHPELL